MIERHKGTGRTGVGILSGFGLRGGAIASSVSHDSHNIIVVGDNDADMELAVNELVRTQGGYTIVENGAVSMTLALPIMGLMSDAGYENVNATLKKMLAKAERTSDGRSEGDGAIHNPVFHGSSGDTTTADHAQGTI